MSSRFDEIVERGDSASVKHDNMMIHFGRTDLLPMWVADMDFKSPQAVLDAAMERCKHGVFGYTFRTDNAKQAFVDWVAKRDKWSITKEQITISPGICTALSVAVRSYSNPGDRVVIMTPVYHPFHEVVLRNERELSRSPLNLVDGKYEIDWADLESRLNGAAMLILCNPHNPLGRVWSYEELKRIGELCVKYGGIIISDEIHFDLIMPGFKHVSMGTFEEKYLNNCAICTAPSKTFNLAGLQTSNIFIPNEEYRNRMTSARGYFSLNIFGYKACELAYDKCEECTAIAKNSYKHLNSRVFLVLSRIFQNIIIFEDGE